MVKTNNGGTTGKEHTMTARGTLTIALAQMGQMPIGKPFGAFENSVRYVASQRGDDGRSPELVVFPEMHLYGTEHFDEDRSYRMQCAAATDLHDEFTARLGKLARELGIWLIPGTVAEKNPEGGIFNTAPVFSPEGELVVSYRKICPWRPYERYTPGSGFTVFDIPGKGRVGIMICYDAWFPEISRQIAWMGADIIINPVRTTTPDRAQELILARANAIVNQTFIASLNAPAPQGVGRSLLVDPEGGVIDATEDEGEHLIIRTIDLDEVRRVHEQGTAGSNRMWEQFRPGEPPIELPLYEGSISPNRWHIRR